MPYRTIARLIVLAGLIATHVAHADVIDERLQAYQSEGAKEFNAERGKAMWTKLFKDEESGEMHNCATCHTETLSKAGKHATTGKPIDPMDPTVNAERFTDAKKVEKWFKRNCKWTLGRECTAQEKGDYLMYFRAR